MNIRFNGSESSENLFKTLKSLRSFKIFKSHFKLALTDTLFSINIYKNICLLTM